MNCIQPWLWRTGSHLRLHKLGLVISSQASPVLHHDQVYRQMASESSTKSKSLRIPETLTKSSSHSSVLEFPNNAPSVPLSSLSTIQTTTTSLVGQIDRHSGVTVDVSYLPVNVGPLEFSRLLTESLDVWRAEGRGAIWLNIPLGRSQLIESAAAEGFLFHHAEGSCVMMKLWLRTDRQDTTPLFATHQLGVSGIAIREDTKEVLVVQDKNRPYTLWKFPGGLANLGEDIEKTAVREVLEETGVKTEFQSILAFRQQHEQPGAFGRSDLYVLCRLRPLTYDLAPCSEEIGQCRWMTLEELRAEMKNTSSLTTRLTDIVQRGLDEGFDSVDITTERHRSVYRGMVFSLFFRPLKLEDNDSAK